jgi:DNA polymerase III alpha subunit (gram-positive type)
MENNNSFERLINDQAEQLVESSRLNRPISAEEAQNLHNRLVVTQAVNYKKQGYTNIKVNHAGNQKQQPVQIEGYIPDLSAVLDSQTTICEIETHDSINNLSVIEKWKAFDNSGCQFHLIIPNDDFDQVKDMVKSNGISVDKYWNIKDY